MEDSRIFRLANELHLPDELLLQVATSISGRPRDRNATLRNLTLTCRRMRQVGQEALLTSTCFHLRRIISLIRVLVKFPNLARKVTSLEIHVVTNHSEWVAEEQLIPDLPPPLDLERLDTALKEACVEIIRKQETLQATKQTWIKDLEDPNQQRQAFIGLLFVLTPNIKSLFLGPSNMRQFLFLGTPLSNSTRCAPRPYLLEAFRPLIPNLTELEMPAVWGKYSMNNLYTDVIINTRRFGNLQSITLPSNAILFPQQYSFPQSLRHIRITRAWEESFKWCIRVLEDGTNLPYLRLVEFYHLQSDQGPDNRPIWHDTWRQLIAYGRKRGVDIHSWRPVRELDDLVVHYQPWRYTWMELLEIETNLANEYDAIREEAEEYVRIHNKMPRYVRVLDRRQIDTPYRAEAHLRNPRTGRTLRSYYITVPASFYK